MDKTRLFAILSLLFLLTNLHAQLDTVLYEGFQGVQDPFLKMALSPSGNDTSWVNYDEDGLPCTTLLEADKRWNLKQFYFMPLDSMTGETNFCAGSYSFLNNSLPGNRNWLILPPIHVDNNTYTLHWLSAPSQLPRYMDGYVVLASTAGNTVGEFTDTLFQAASMDKITGNGQSLVLSNFKFTPGYVHADNMTLAQFFAPNGAGTIAYGKLEPHSASLSSMKGKTVYIAFLHNSDDDDRIAVDDILVARSSTVGTGEAATSDLRFVAYPNPVDNFLNVLFSLEKPTAVSVEVADAAGREVFLENKGEMPLGEQQLSLDLRPLPPGMYALTFRAGGQGVSKIFRKR